MPLNRDASDASHIGRAAVARGETATVDRRYRQGFGLGLGLGLVLAALVACGGDGEEEEPALLGLGQACVLAMQGNDCPSQAMGCLGYPGNTTMGFCSPLCVTGGTMVSSAQGDLAITPDPEAAGPTATCTSAFVGRVGQVACTGVVLWSPQDAVLVPGKTYTDVGVACEIFCSADKKCPGALRCVDSDGGRCEI